MRPNPTDQPAFRRALRTLVPQEGRPAGDHAEIFGGIGDEVGGPIGALLERSLDDVRRWATAPAGHRRTLLRRERGLRRTGELSRIEIPGALSGSLGAVRDLLIRPGEISTQRIATACATVARWAWARNHPRTSIAWRLAATMTLPRCPIAALGLARVLSELAQWTEAERWLDRAEALAAGHADARVALRAVVGRADILVARGRLEEAAELYDSALRRESARRSPEMRGAAHHGLCVIRARTGHLEDAEDHAARALRCYGPSHPGMQAVLREIAFIRLERGDFAAALPLLAALVRAVPPHARVAALGSLARAAGGLGDETIFEDARHALERSVVNRWSGEAWLEVARGALLLGDPEEAAELAERAIVIGMERGEARILYLADDFLDVVEGEATAGQGRRDRLRCPESVRSLTSDLLSSLRGDGSGPDGTIE